MAITGAVAAAIRKEDPYADWIGMGARAILDPGGFRTGGRPYYWLLGRAYRRFLDIPGAVVAANSQRLSKGVNGIWRPFAANVPREIPFVGLDVRQSWTNKVTASGAAPPTLIAPSTLAVFNPLASPSGIQAQSGDANTRWAVVDDIAAMSSGVLAGLVGNPLNGRAYVLDNLTSATVALMTITGTAVNTNPHSISAFVRGSGNGQVRLSGSPVTPTPFTSDYQRRSVVQTPIDTVVRGIVISAEPGAIVYVILPNLIETAFDLDEVVASNGSAGIAASDSIALTNIQAALVGDFTVLSEVQLPAMDGVSRTLCEINDGSNLNRAISYRGSDNSGGTFVASASVGTSAGVGGKGGARVLKTASRVRAAEHAAWIDGVGTATFAQAAPISLARWDIGYRSYSGQHLNGAYRRGAIFGDLADVYNARLTA